MRWFLLLLCVGVVVGTKLRCDPPLCSVEASDYPNWLKFHVEGGTVEVNYTESYFYVNCHKGAALDSLAMLYFTSKFHASTVVLADCPLPTNSSLAAALVPLNVTLQPTNDGTCLKLIDLPTQSQLAPHYFSGLEHLTNLSIESYFDPIPTPSAGFFGLFKNLRSLQLRGIKLSPSELYSLPRTLQSIDLTGDSLKIISSRILPEVLTELLLALPNLVTVTLQERIEPDHLFDQPASTNITRVLTNATSSLETLIVYFWPEQRLTVFEQCENLRVLEISKSVANDLPDRFVAACSRLEELRITFSIGIKEVPAKLLEGATALKRLSFKSCTIWSLPEGFFQGTPNLIELDLSYNSIDSLPSDIFLGLPLQSLALRHNLLNDTERVSKDLAKLTSLTELDLASNILQNFCDKNGYSSLATLTGLKKLDLSHNSVTRICRDWRQNLTHLEFLILNSDQMRILRADDFQITRDPSVKYSIVNLGKWLISINFTEDDYKNALTAPETGATIIFETEYVYDNYSQIECDCSLYWLRLAVENASHAVKIEDFPCRNNRYFKDIKPDELCPERKSTTTTKP